MIINLYVSYFLSNDIQRNIEIRKVIQQNIDLSYINNIYLFSEYDVNNDFNSNKIKIIHTINRVKYSDIFKYIKDNNLEICVNIVANADIYFDDSISHVINLNVFECYALSRYDNNKLTPNSHWTQDVWILKNITNELIEKSDIMFGIPGCDNRIASILQECQYSVRNPSLSIKSHHMHDVSIRDYKESDRLHGKYLFIKSCQIEDLKYFLSCKYYSYQEQ